MAAQHPSSSFSPGQRLKLGFQVAFGTLLVLAIVGLANYLSRDYSMRFHLSSRTKAELSSRTVFFLKTITNRVTVSIYYDRTDPLYSTISDLLNEYHMANPKIMVRTVDYLRDPAGAQALKAQYQLGSVEEKNLVIFDAGGGKWKPIDGNALAQYSVEQVPPSPGEEERKFRRRMVSFLGEMAFNSALLNVTSPRQMNAYFLRGHQEHDIGSGDELNGYLNFASVLKQQNVQVKTLTLVGTNSIPQDCSLLIVAGPRQALAESELNQISKYLDDGGRLMVLFNAGTAERATGLERILSQWGVAVGANVISDPQHSQFGSDVIVGFSLTGNKHPVTNPLSGTGLFLIQPRTISKSGKASDAADAPRVEELAFTGENSFLVGEPSQKRHYPVMVAVEKGAVTGVASERGATRILVVGDSLFLGNRQLELLGNRDFAVYSANWLLDRTQLLGGIGPQPVSEFRLVMTKTQTQTAQLVLLGAMPGAVLLLGSLVWLRRRR